MSEDELMASFSGSFRVNSNTMTFSKTLEIDANDPYRLVPIVDAGGKLLAAQGTIEVVPLLPDGAILTNHSTGERWRWDGDEWVPMESES